MDVKTTGADKTAHRRQLKAYERMTGARSKRGQGKRTVEIRITVRIPALMTKKDAMREVRTLVNEQCNYSADPGDVKIVRAR